MGRVIRRRRRKRGCKGRKGAEVAAAAEAAAGVGNVRSEEGKGRGVDMSMLCERKRNIEWK